MEDMYWHAGTALAPGQIVWSDHTHRSRAAAEREAQRLARREGGTPLIEAWPREHGLRPGDADVVVATYVRRGDRWVEDAAL
jgi:hypothetical protein